MGCDGWTHEQMLQLLADYESMSKDVHRGKALSAKHKCSLKTIYIMLERARACKQLQSGEYIENGVKVIKYKTVSAANVPFKRTVG